MVEDIEAPQGKTLNDLGHEALWFAAHTIIAIVTMVIVVLVMGLFHPDPEATMPKILGTALVFLVPLVVGLIIARRNHNEIGRYVWISALLIFSIACVWAIDLPTGPGLCEHCTSLFERIQRTFFSFDNGSGLMGGQGVLIGFWAPLALIGYAIGAKLGLDS